MSECLVILVANYTIFFDIKYFFFTVIVIENHLLNITQNTKYFVIFLQIVSILLIRNIFSSSVPANTILLIEQINCLFLFSIDHNSIRPVTPFHTSECSNRQLGPFISPCHRDFLEHEEAIVEHLEQKLEKTIKLCALAVDSGKEYIKNQSAFATSLTDLQSHFIDDRTGGGGGVPAANTAHKALGKIIECVQEMNKFHTTLLDQASRTVLKNLREYIRTDIRQVKDYRLLFAKVSESLDVALTRNAQANKNRPTEVAEATNYLEAATSCFRYTSLDYVNMLIMLRSKKVPEILWTVSIWLWPVVR